MPVKNRLNNRNQHHSQQPQPDQWFSSNQSDFNVDPRYSTTNETQKTNSKRPIRGYHKNACRTKVHFLLDKKEGLIAGPQQKKKKRTSFFLMSEDYKRKMSEGFDIPEEQYVATRKISWSEQSQYVAFNKKKSCQAIKLAPRHKFSIDE